MKLSLCITNYNRTTLLEESFKEVLGDDRINEIIISDDNSDPETCRFLHKLARTNNKIKLFFHAQNVGMYENKKRAIEYATNDWCILFDSDNVITPSYISAFLKQAPYPEKDCIYCPDFAFPQFDYRKYAGKYFNLEMIKPLLKEPMFECLLNTCNYIVQRKKYLKTWELPTEHFGADNDVRAADSIYFMYLWIKAGLTFAVVPNMLYNHRVHGGSGFMQDTKGNLERASFVKRLILNL
jgi:glycosyltransferase involved in cell wall biosynthesis